MLGFRAKIFVSYLLIFLTFIAIIFPFSSKTVKRIVYSSMLARSRELIAKIENAATDQELVQNLKDQRALVFFRVSLISDENKVLYDSHIKRLLGPRFSDEYIVDHPEVIEAFKTGVGYSEEFSDLLGQRFFYIATAFQFHGKTYVMRCAFPYKYISDLTQDFELGFAILTLAILILFSLMSWVIIYHLSGPIQQIITTIKPYQEGLDSTIPEIHLRYTNPNDDFGRLAATLNSLSQKMQAHLDSVIRERNEKEAILESLSEGVLAIDEWGEIAFANSKASEFLEIPQSEFVREPLKTIEKLPSHELIQICQEQNQSLSNQYSVKQQEKKKYYNLVVTPMLRGGAVMVIQDVTLQNQIMEMRQAFIANASHELKTPITIIQGFAETLQEYEKLSSEIIGEITGKIVKNCVRMTHTIKDLLMLADIENIPERRLHPYDIEEIATHCRERLLELYPQAQIAIEKPEGLSTELRGDVGLMEQVMWNLFENAAKYSPSDQEISITARFFDAGEKLKVEVEDRGIGIPEQHLEHVFQRFYTVDKKQSRSKGGSGLGLSIVESIVEKHSGSITVRSTVGKGTTFTLLLPKPTDYS